MEGRERASSAMIAAALCLTWALTFIAQRTALREADPLWVAAGRTGLGALVLVPWLRPLGRRGWWIAGGLALVNVVGFVGLQLLGLDAIGAGPAAAIVYTQPVLVVVGAHLLLGERLTPARAAGVLLGFAGVAVVSAHELSAASVLSVAALLGCAVCWAAGDALYARDARAADPGGGRRAARARRAGAGRARRCHRARAGAVAEARRRGAVRRRGRGGRRPAAVHAAAAPRRGVGRRRVDVQRADRGRCARRGPARGAAASAARDRARARQPRSAAGEPAARARAGVTRRAGGVRPPMTHLPAGWRVLRRAERVGWCSRAAAPLLAPVCTSAASATLTASCP